MNTAVSVAAGEQPGIRIPGDFAMWCFILVELATFGLLFTSIGIARALDPAAFSGGLATVHPAAGIANTLLLLTGSYLVARGIAIAGRSGVAACAPWLYAGAATGACYAVIKLAEYAVLIRAGYTLHSGTFHFFYFFTTAFHFMHVLLGMAMLMVVARRSRRGCYAHHDMRVPESVASYWHMVDLVWLVLFPLLYVLP